HARRARRRSHRRPHLRAHDRRPRHRAPAARMSAPTVAVVIPSYRRLQRLPDLVRAYRAQGADEIVVVLDGPQAGWRDAVSEASHLRVLELPENRGLALARIAGLRACTADVVLAVDDDVEPGPDLVE